MWFFPTGVSTVSIRHEVKHYDIMEEKTIHLALCKMFQEHTNVGGNDI